MLQVLLKSYTRTKQPNKHTKHLYGGSNFFIITTNLYLTFYNFASSMR